MKLSLRWYYFYNPPVATAVTGDVTVDLPVTETAAAQTAVTGDVTVDLSVTETDATATATEGGYRHRRRPRPLREQPRQAVLADVVSEVQHGAWAIGVVRNPSQIVGFVSAEHAAPEASGHGVYDRSRWNQLEAEDELILIEAA